MFGVHLPNTGSTKKSSSKPINMRSSFEDLNARISKVKTVCHLNGRFSRYFVFLTSIQKIKGKKALPSHLLCPLLSHLHINSGYNSGYDSLRTCKHPRGTLVTTERLLFTGRPVARHDSGTTVLIVPRHGTCSVGPVPDFVLRPDTARLALF